MPDIFAVDADLVGDGALEKSPKPESGDRIANESLKHRSGDSIAKESSGESIAKEALRPNSSEPEPTVAKFTKGLSKRNFGGDNHPKESRSRRSCDEAARSRTEVASRSGARDVGSVERVTQGSSREASEIRATPGWEKVRVQTDSGAIDAVGPKEVAKALAMKEAVMFK
jgi:hypothetical protein